MVVVLEERVCVSKSFWDFLRVVRIVAWTFGLAWRWEVRDGGTEAWYDVKARDLLCHACLKCWLGAWNSFALGRVGLALGVWRNGFT